MPDLQVQPPKGLSRARDPRKEDIGPQETDSQGEKRIRDKIGYREIPGQRPSKRQRSKSPGNPDSIWRETPTFRKGNQDTEEEMDVTRPSNKAQTRPLRKTRDHQIRIPPLRTFADIIMRRQPKVEMNKEVNRTPVRTRVKGWNRRYGPLQGREKVVV